MASHDALASVVTKSCFNLVDREDVENGESSWLCLCCHTVGEFDTEDELIAHHITNNLEYDECYICCIPPDNLEEYMGKVLRIRTDL